MSDRGTQSRMQWNTAGRRHVLETCCDSNDPMPPTGHKQFATDRHASQLLFTVHYTTTYVYLCFFNYFLVSFFLSYNSVYILQLPKLITHSNTTTTSWPWPNAVCTNATSRWILFWENRKASSESFALFPFQRPPYLPCSLSMPQRTPCSPSLTPSTL